MLSGSIVRALSGGNTELAIQLTSVLAITAGVVLVATGGVTGPELFPKAVAALKAILDQVGGRYQ